MSARRRDALGGRLGRDLELEAGSAAHYEDPVYYAKTYRTRDADVRYYADLARERGGPVLEYGCGNGRITLPVARLGPDVTGVDLSAPMLADLRARLAQEPAAVRERVTLKRGDMRRVKLKQRFPLVLCPFNAFLHLYTRADIEAFLARVREHLTPHGELCFDVSIPEPAELARDPGRLHHTPRFRYPSADDPRGEVVKYAERFDYDRIRQVLFVSMEFSPVSGKEGWMTPLAHRQLHPQELEALLHYNGFEIGAAWGDFERGPLGQTSEVLVLRCTQRRGFQPR